MIYTVSWFNYISNSDIVDNVNAKSELETALIVHTYHWTNQREFNFEDYQVCEYSEDYILTRSDSKWTDEEFEKAKLKAMKKFIKDNYKLYKQHNQLEYLYQECKDRLGMNESMVLNVANELE